ncbi:vWA domain-containing protein [Jatrophihabitans sp. DSM 45814]
MITVVEGLIAELRKVGFPISVSENIDAVQALRYVALDDRESVKTALGSVLVKDSEHESAYEAIFDIYFALRRPEDELGSLGQDGGSEGEDHDAEGEDGLGSQGAGGAGGGGGGGALDSLDDAAIRQLLIGALENEQSMLIKMIANTMVTRHAGIQPGRAVAGTYYLYRTMRAVDPDRILTTLVSGREQREGEATGLSRRLMVEEYERRLAQFQQEIEAAIRRRLVADRGSDAVAKTLRKPLPEDVDFLTASTKQLEEVREILAPMTRKLAAKLAEKRRHHRKGSLDFRKTVRRSMSTGGIPLVPVFRKPRPSKPELFILADISGSVSTFAAFTLQLTYALRSEFSKVRSFVFVDGIDEVTELLAQSDNIAEVTKRINAEGRGVWLDGRSDYGNALDTFWERFGSTLKHRTTVLLLGDARTNYHATRASVIKEIAQQAGNVFWLNPEPRPAWDSGDSVMKEYAKYCDGVFECRNVRQLKHFIEQLG